MKESRQRNLIHVLLLAVIVLGWALALYRIGSRSFWADEGATAHTAQHLDSLSSALALHKEYHFFHLVVSAAVVKFSGSEFAIRFPSALAAVLTLPILYLLGVQLSKRTVGLIATFLLAISPFAVGYAQEARSYAFLEMLSCFSLLFLLLALARRNWLWWVGYVISASLLLYTHFFGWFVVGAEVLFAAIILLWRSLTKRRVDLRLLGLAASSTAIAILYLPLVPSFLDFVSQYGLGDGSVQLEGLRPFEFSFKFFKRMVIHFGPKAGGWRFYLYVVGIGLGFASLTVRKNWRTLLLLFLWLALPVAFMTIVSPTHFFDYRFVIFILPLFLLVVAEGVAAVAHLLAKLARGERRWSLELALTCLLAVVLFVPANWPALQTHYEWEKENWQGIGGLLHDNIQSDEAIFVAPYFWAFPLRYYQPDLEAQLIGGDGLSKLEGADAKYAGVWYLQFAAPFSDPSGELNEWITARDFERLVEAEGCGHGIHVYYRRFDDTAPQRQANLLEQAADLCPP